MTNYDYKPEKAFKLISNEMKEWAHATNAKNFILGISGGKDSTITAMLLSEIFGPEHVYGVMMPCGKQNDIDDSHYVIDTLKINKLCINIGDAFKSLMDQIENPSDDCRTNLPPRLRMASLFALGQCYNARVVNTDNLTETMLGYSTFGGDNFGSFAPIGQLTVTEVVALGDYLIGNMHTKLNHDQMNRLRQLVHKVPADGLQPLTDEENLGVKYADVDKFIRLNEGSPKFKEKVMKKYRANKFKHTIVQLPTVMMPYENYIAL